MKAKQTSFVSAVNPYTAGNKKERKSPSKDVKVINGILDCKRSISVIYDGGYDEIIFRARLDSGKPKVLLCKLNEYVNLYDCELTEDLPF